MLSSWIKQFEHNETFQPRTLQSRCYHNSHLLNPARWHIISSPCLPCKRALLRSSKSWHSHALQKPHRICVPNAPTCPTMLSPFIQPRTVGQPAGLQNLHCLLQCGFSAHDAARWRLAAHRAAGPDEVGCRICLPAAVLRSVETAGTRCLVWCWRAHPTREHTPMELQTACAGRGAARQM